MTSASLYARYLSSENQKKILEEIISQGFNDKDQIPMFCELLDCVGRDMKTEMEETIYNHCQGLLIQGESLDNYQSMLLLMSRFPVVQSRLLDSALNTILSYLEDNMKEKYLLRESLNVSFEGNVISQLKFVQSLLLHFPNNENQRLYHLLPLLLFMEDRKIIELASGTLRYMAKGLIETGDCIWDVLFRLLEKNPQEGFKLWVRLTSNGQELEKNASFQAQLVKEVYWANLLKGLSSRSHEQRKLTLTILQLSVKSINSSFDVRSMKWETDKTSEYLQAWKKFITLYEIIAIDTSLHQAQAAASDIIEMTSPNSLIRPQFALKLLAVGFMAPLDSVRKFSMRLILDTPAENMGIFAKDDYDLFQNTFLPYTVMGQNFHSNDRECKFGAIISAFISNFIDAQRCTVACTAVMRFLSENQHAFDPARFFLAKGLLEGLDRSRQKILGSLHLTLICKLFELHAETELYEIALQSLHLRLLTFVSLEDVSFHEFWYTLSQCKKTELVADNSEIFLDYLSESVDKGDLVSDFEQTMGSMEVECCVVALFFITQLAASPMAEAVLSYPNVDILLLEMTRSNLRFDAVFENEKVMTLCADLNARLLTSSVDSDVLYERSDRFVNLFDDTYWSKVTLTDLFDKVISEISEHESLSKMHYLVLCVQKCIYNEEVEQVLVMPLLEKMQNLINTKRRSNLFKQKFSQYLYDLLFQLLKVQDLAGLNRVVENSILYTGFHGKVSLLKVLDFALERNADPFPIVAFLEQIWSDMLENRLILNQQELQTSWIKLAFHPKILKLSASNKKVSDSLGVMGSQLIELSFARKSLMPTLAACLCEFYTEDPELFVASGCVSSLLVRMYFLQHSKSNLFLMEEVVGLVFDSELSFMNESVSSAIYGLPEESYRAVAFALMANLSGQKVWDFIFENESEFHLAHPIKRTDGVEEWRRTQLWQILNLLAPKLESAYISSLTATLVDLLLKEASPVCRTYIEWILVIGLVKSPSSSDTISQLLEVDLNNQVSAVVTCYLRMWFLWGQQMEPIRECDFLVDLLVKYVIPACASNRALIRHFSISLIASVRDEICRKRLAVPREIMRVLDAVCDNVTKSEWFGRFRYGDEVLWNTHDDFTLAGLSGAVVRKIFDREFDCVSSEDFNRFVPQKVIASLDVNVGQSYKVSSATMQKSSAKATPSSMLQTKSGAWNSIVDVDATERAIKRSDLIVVSSLVDKAPNLGGICRLSDVLGAGLLTVNDLSVKNHPHFKSVAVTADSWMPMEEVKMEDVKSFMREKKREGYTLIGLEQTDESICLTGSFKFPKKSLFLLGKEKEGIPGELLTELDTCIEIKQVGVIRSMNIQTATAVLVHAYSSQHC